MTWIAACNGQRGIYQEVIMTDEERQKLCEALRSCPTDPIEIIAWARMAANEIERLAEYKQKVDEALRSVAVNGSTLGSGYRAAELIDKLWQTVLQHDNETALLRTALKVARDQNVTKSQHHMSSARETDMGTAE